MIIFFSVREPRTDGVSPSVVQEAVNGVRCLGDADESVHEMRVADLPVGQRCGDGEALTFEPVGMHKVGIVSCGYAREHIIGVEVRKELPERAAGHDFLQFVVVIDYIVA